MSAPTTIPADAIRATVTSTAKLVTEYMPAAPATVINTGTDRVWIGSGSEVSPSNGVPVEAGAYVVWNRAGVLYAVLDPAATSSSAEIYASTALSAWQPSPAAIAAELLANGVPNVLTETQIYDQVIPRNTSPAAIDVSGYASLQITVTPQNTPQNEMIYYWSSDGSTQLVGDFLSNTFQELPVRAQWLQLVNQSTTTDVLVTIVGSNRSLASGHDQAGSFTNSPIQFSLPSTTMTAAVFYPVPIVHSNFNFPMPTGRCYLVANLTSATAARGILNLQYTAPDGTTQNMPLIDTAEMHLDWTNGALFGSKEVILPMNTNWQLSFQCRVAGTTVVVVTLVRDAI